MQPPGRSVKPKIKIALKGREHGFYSNMWSQAAQDNSTLGGKDAVTFLKRSGVSVDKLKQFWLIAARTSATYLTRDEFYLALRLIAYEQHGMPAEERTLLMDLDVGLPTFQSDFQTSASSTTAASSMSAQPEIRAEEMAAVLPSLDDLDINQMNTISSLIPSVDQAKKQA